MRIPDKQRVARVTTNVERFLSWTISSLPAPEEASPLSCYQSIKGLHSALRCYQLLTSYHSTDVRRFTGGAGTRSSPGQQNPIGSTDPIAKADGTTLSTVL